ncbi:MAG TPA: Gfo/Idh/MocA family oxidoreductase [Candidatus Angelobacter sp.]|nr:Gfo/Idh/MocA family oxidoreductase [Candidatus Angelobacter sp.]
MTIRLGIVGCGYGKTVMAPAFRADSRCHVAAIAASSQPSANAAASQLGVARAFGDWRGLVNDSSVDAVAVAVPPHLQPEIVLAAIEACKPVFAEKPLAVRIADARRMAEQAESSRVANMVDFNFSAIAPFLQTRKMLQENAIGKLRHIVVNWQTESYTNRARIQNWKSDSDEGGGSLSNFVSHCLHYLEWFAGPIAGLNGHLFRLPDDTRPSDSDVSLAMEFQNGAGSMLAMSAAAFPGSGHRIEFYGEDGSLILENLSRDYMRGFRLFCCHRPDTAMTSVTVNDQEEDICDDGRILPLSRLARQFFDWIENGKPARPDFRDALRVQELIEAARASHRNGWIKTS